MPFKAWTTRPVLTALIIVFTVGALVVGLRYYKTRGEESIREAGHDQQRHDDVDDGDWSPESLTAKVKSAEIETYVKAPGIVDFHPKHALRIHPTFPGIVLKVNRSVGDNVSTGDVLATVESNVGIQTYSITSPIRGVVIARNVSEGQSVVPEEELFSVGDASVLQAKLFVAARDVKKVQVNQGVTLVAEQQRTIRSTVRFVSPVLNEETRTAAAIVDFQSPDLRPGMFITGALAVSKRHVETTLPSSYCEANIHSREVMVLENGAMVRRVVALGDRDYEACEVLSGLKTGDEVMLPMMVSTHEEHAEQDDDHDHE